MYGSLQNLQDALEDDICAAVWLNDVLAFLKDSERADEVNSRYIVLGQAGYLDQLGNLFRDDDIDEELKEIADEVGLGLRNQLRDKRLTSLHGEDGKGVKGNREVAQEVIAKLRDKVADGDLEDDFGNASTRVFAWITKDENWDYLRGFPAFSQEDEDSDRDVVLAGPGRPE